MQIFVYMGTLKDKIIGKTYNRLTCIRFDSTKQVPSGNKRAMFLFKCTCGTEKVMCGSMVKRGKIISCGCAALEQIKKLAKQSGKAKGSYRHGFFGTRFYNIYFSMVARTSKKLRFYENIKCNWKTFLDFKADMYESYLVHVKEFGERNTTLDRINGKDHYYKKNCRWATYKQQQNNRKDNLKIEINGVVKNLCQWKECLNTTKYQIMKKLKTGEYNILGEIRRR